jgi:hypothetical protein
LIPVNTSKNHFTPGQPASKVINDYDNNGNYDFNDYDNYNDITNRGEGFDDINGDCNKKKDGVKHNGDNDGVDGDNNYVHKKTTALRMMTAIEK